MTVKIVGIIICVILQVIVGDQFSLTCYKFQQTDFFLQIDAPFQTLYNRLERCKVHTCFRNYL